MTTRFWAAGGVVIAAGLAGLMAGVPPAAQNLAVICASIVTPARPGIV